MAFTRIERDPPTPFRERLCFGLAALTAIHAGWILYRSGWHDDLPPVLFSMAAFIALALLARRFRLGQEHRHLEG